MDKKVVSLLPSFEDWWEIRLKDTKEVIFLGSLIECLLEIELCDWELKL